MHVSNESDINVCIWIIKSTRVFDYTIYINVIAWSALWTVWSVSQLVTGWLRSLPRRFP